MEKYDLIIKNANVVSPENTILCDIAVKDEKIAGLGSYDAKDAAKCIDAAGKYVMPGGVEAHMHCHCPFQGVTGKIDFDTQSVAAVYGGVTTYMDFSNMSRGQSPYQQVLERAKEMEKSIIDYGVHGKFLDATPEAVADMEKLVENGFPTFKIFMTYDVMCNDADMDVLFKKASELHAMPMVHCEDNTIATENDKKFKEAGDTSWPRFADSKPVECEAEAFKRAVGCATKNNSALLVVHTTTDLALSVAREVQKDKFPLYVETGPHYLTLTRKLYDDPQRGHLAICSPPLRTEKEQAELWAGIQDGTIRLIGSDDCSFYFSEKSMNLQKDEDGNWIEPNYMKVVNGLSGLELRLPLMLSEGVNKGRISINKVCELTSTNVAKIYGCYPQKGAIAVGSDADLVIVDMDKKVTLNQDVLHNGMDYCLHEGMEVTGWPVTTIARGTVLMEDRAFKGVDHKGKLIRRHIDAARFETCDLNK
ncbi:MAG: amidohydrolase family protein [Eubacteriales bacterium]|nr:amidohydrolase family protein [Eubacteriales bacterium]